MARGMMTTKYKRLRTILFTSIFLISFSEPLFCETSKWVIAAQRFIYSRGQTKNAVTSNIEETIPSDILEKISTSIKRNIMPDERFERSNYKLKTERQSLYLQLSSEYKKRDSLVLNNYSDLRMKSEIKSQEKKILEIQEKLKKNIAEQKKISAEAELEMKIAAGESDLSGGKELNEATLVKNFVKNIFKKGQTLITEENIDLYKSDVKTLFKPSDTVAADAYTEPLFEKQVVSAGINALITGSVTSYGDFISVAVDLYNYPGAKKICSVLEVGELKELDLITSEISRQLLPAIANTLPVEFTFSIEPEEAKEKLSIFVDDILQKTDAGSIVLDSGIHRIQFVSEGYRTAGTTYFFEGNTKYNINVKFEKPVIGYIQIKLKNKMPGTIYANGEQALKINDGKSQISINGTTILGEFISENNETSFFYIPKKQTFDGNVVMINPRPMDRMEYINVRRKWMYGAYTLFMASLIPMFYTYGNFQIQSELYAKQLSDYQTAKRWQTASVVTEAITVGFGIFWGIELIRYLVAANSVLPQTVQPGNPREFKFYEPAQDTDQSKKNEKDNN